MTTTPHPDQHLFTFDAPGTNTVYVTATTERDARDKLATALDHGVLLDTDAGDGVFLHQAGPLAGSLPALVRIDDRDCEHTSPTDDADAEAALPPRVAPGCDVTACPNAAEHVVVLTIADRRQAELMCGGCAEHYRRHPAGRRPVITPLTLDDKATLPAYAVQPWMVAWSEPGVPEWGAREWAWLVVRTVTVRRADGRRRVRLVFQGGSEREFGYYQRLIGSWRFGRPEPEVL